MGRPPRRFPRANGRFCTPHSDHRTTLHSGDTQHPHRGLHGHVGASPPRHSHRTRLTSESSHALLEDPNLAWQVRGGGRVWHLAIARGSSRSGGVWYSS